MVHGLSAIGNCVNFVTIPATASHIINYLCIIVAKSATADLKKSTYHIFCAWALLICFAAGQYMVYAHQHNIVKTHGKAVAVAKSSGKQTVSEKCQLCDVMHHTAMVITNNIHYNPITVTGHIYHRTQYDFTSLQLILSGGRAPPASILAV